MLGRAMERGRQARLVAKTAAKSAAGGAKTAAKTAAGGLAGAAAGAAVGGLGGAVAGAAVTNETVRAGAHAAAAQHLPKAVGSVLDWDTTRAKGEARFVALFGGTDAMPACVRRLAAGIFAVVWAEFKLEVVDAVGTKLARAGSDAPPSKPPRCGAWLRAQFLYANYPCDRSFWRQLRSPLFLLSCAATLCPFYGVRPAFYTLLLLLMERRDEFQLVRFIQAFKASQFFTGVLMLLTSSTQYFYCSAFRASRCDATGGHAASFEISPVAAAASFASNVVLVWVAFLLLRCASPSVGGELPRVAAGGGGGGPQQQQQPPPPPPSGAWTYLRWLLLWDALVFVLTAGGLLLFLRRGLGTWNLQTAIEADEGDVFRECLFFAKTLYAIGAFPFTLVALPLEGLVFRLLTHARPTGYDKWGRVQPKRVPRGAHGVRSLWLGKTQAALAAGSVELMESGGAGGASNGRETSQI